MKIYHEEEPIVSIINGKKFTIYKDAYTEDLGSFKCPCCQLELKYSEGNHLLAQNYSVKSYEVYCDHCNLSFFGYQGIEDLGFIDKNDFLMFVKSRLNMRLEK